MWIWWTLTTAKLRAVVRGAGAGAGSELAPPREKSRVFRVRGVFVCGELRLRMRIGTTAKACDSEAEERAAALGKLGSVDWGLG